MKQSFTIRPAVAKDYDAINGLMKADHVEYAERMPELFKPLESEALRRGTFLNSLEPEEDDWQYFVATVDDKVVGYIELSIETDEGNRMRQKRKTVLIDELVVDKAHQHHGIGTALMKQAEAWAQDNDIRHLGLDVYTFRDHSKQLYEHLGYTNLRTTMHKELKS